MNKNSLCKWSIKVYYFTLCSLYAFVNKILKGKLNCWVSSELCFVWKCMCMCKLHLWDIFTKYYDLVVDAFSPKHLLFLVLQPLQEGKEKININTWVICICLCVCVFACGVHSLTTMVRMKPSLNGVTGSPRPPWHWWRLGRRRRGWWMCIILPHIATLRPESFSTGIFI